MREWLRAEHTLQLSDKCAGVGLTAPRIDEPGSRSRSGRSIACRERGPVFVFLDERKHHPAIAAPLGKALPLSPQDLSRFNSCPETGPLRPRKGYLRPPPAVTDKLGIEPDMMQEQQFIVIGALKAFNISSFTLSGN
jgi:hypothetical protein